MLSKCSVRVPLGYLALCDCCASGVAAGSTAEAMRADPLSWQQKLLQMDYELFDRLPTGQLVLHTLCQRHAGEQRLLQVFSDTSFVETVVFSERAGLQLGTNIQQWIDSKR